jgi:hypothetical protein
MPWTSEHCEWLNRTEDRLSTIGGTEIQVWQFHHCDDERVLSAWATHFRNHYCLDERIDDARGGTGYSRSEFLNEIIFPDPTHRPGPSIRSGDFAEILVSDFLQYILNFWVPRTRYGDKIRSNQSTQGCDIIGFKFIEEGVESPEDILAIFETKAQFRGRLAQAKLQEAVDHSGKDQVRKAFSLNAIKHRLRYTYGDEEGANRVERFQSLEDNPYTEISGAAALFTSEIFNPDTISKTTCEKHPNRNNLTLLIIHGADMMPLVHGGITKIVGI